MRTPSIVRPKQPQAPMPLGRSKRLPLVQSVALLILASVISGCATLTPGINSPPPPNKISIGKLVCAPWKPITYSTNHDTKETVDQIKTHNKTGQNLHCWK